MQLCRPFGVMLTLPITWPFCFRRLFIFSVGFKSNYRLESGL
jgi:hypothetical protein